MTLQWKYEPAEVTWEYSELARQPAQNAWWVMVSDDGISWRLPNADDFRSLGWLPMGGGMWHPPKGWPPPPEQGTEYG